MIRTQVYLPEDLYSQIMTNARMLSLPAAKVIRDALRRGMKRNKKIRNNLLSLVKLNLTGGPKDLSANLDTYLYGEKI